ncbi:MAG: tRNA preQ1(34) S-adenosylmethionine ribosyltransferase-isomerase QueA [Verrucomicrobiales bacterium]|nr:tRNA preQ1(34) S-adenosylmethionine ribosyltransferase-isomerase QueA [Verrucomicrobiales bacterium]
MQTDDFDFELPEELIAQHPPERRGDSRMMVVHRESGKIEHRQFANIGEYVRPGDLWVFNDTRVEPARFFSNDGRKEILKLDAASPNIWKCLVKPGKRLRVGRTIEIGESVGTVTEVLEPGGERIIEFSPEAPDPDSEGHLALPPYIERPDEMEDRDRYQTVYSRETGAIAAPTAGLHFDEEVMDSLPHDFVTLHVGLGTFRPVSAEKVEEHHMHSERFELSEKTATRVREADRVVAVGTTVVRVLESCASRETGSLKTGRGETDIFIYPPYQPKIVDALLTNFHLPKSTLLMLVSAFSSRELMLEAYQKAVESRYRFFSYGDCMLIV